MTFSFDAAGEIAGWTLTGHAQISGAFTPRSAPNVLSLFAQRTSSISASSTAARTVTLVVGQSYHVSVYVDGSSSGSKVTLHLKLTDSSGTHDFSKTGPTAPGWTRWDVADFVPTSASVTVEMSTPAPSFTGGLGTSGTWLADDLSINTPQEEAVMASKRDALAALQSQVALLNGSGFRTNLGGRVYLADIIPEDSGGQVLPYATIVPTEERIKHMQRGTLESTWGCLVSVYLSEAWNDETVSEGMLSCADVEDDLKRAILLDQRLGGTVADLALDVLVNTGGQLPGKNWCSVEMHVRLQQYVTAASLAV